MHWTEVPGWLTKAEGDQLRELARGKRVLELGSYLGRSTVAMAEVALEVVSLDWHGGDDGTGPANTLASFRANLASLAVAEFVTVMVGRIEDRSHELDDHSFDLVFIDSAHDERSVERDTAVARRVVKPGGVIAYHDWQYPSVQRGSGISGRVHLVDSLAWIEVEGPRGP